MKHPNRIRHRLAVAVAAQALCVSVALAQGRTFTLDADFDEGVLVNVNHDAPNGDQLQLNFETVPFPFVNIAISDRGTAVRIDVNTGEIIGEYSTNPDGNGPSPFPNPSRTTVDKFGNVWVANRAENTLLDGVWHGSIMRYGLVVGGTRVDADGTPNPTGQYLAPPFQYSTAIDRDGDGLIKTSRGLYDVLPWSNTGGVDTFGGVATAEDECIINYVLTPGTGTRTLAVDADNDVWVGCIFGEGSNNHVEVDVLGSLASVDLSTLFNLGCGGYGGFIDGAGYLWSAGRSTGLLRYDTNALSGGSLGTSTGDYGLGLDPNTGEVWHSSLYGGAIYKLDSSGGLLQVLSQQGLSCQGVAVDSNSHVWVAELFGSRVLHYAPDPLDPTNHLFVGVVSGFTGTTGVAIDANGKVWASEMNSSATRGAARIDPAAGPIGGGGFPMGTIDMTVGLGADAGPYNYSDMTGFVLLSAIQEGSWTVVYDTEAAGTAGCTYSWSTDEPAGTSINVEARAADAEADLGGESFVSVVNGTSPGLVGRYIEVRTLFARDVGSQYADLTPVLYDLTVQCNNPPVAICQDVVVSADANCQGDASIDAGSYDPDGDLFTVDISPPGPYPLGDTQVMLVVTDEQGASDMCTATVSVVDTTPPVVVMADMEEMWPPNHKARSFNLEDLVLSIDDNCDGPIGVVGACTVISISSDELEDAPGRGDGATMGDIVISGSTSFELCCEREGLGNGRVYTINVEVADLAGNVTQVSCYVGVPHDKSSGPPIDDGLANGYIVYP